MMFRSSCYRKLTSFIRNKENSRKYSVISAVLEKPNVGNETEIKVILLN